jgi:hypothetical protein
LEVWEELERRGAKVAIVPFSGRAGSGGKVGTIVLRGCHGDQPFASDDELAFALAAPIWDRYDSFAGPRPCAGRSPGRWLTVGW